MLKVLILLSALVACAHGAVVPQNDRRIVGVVKTNITTYPWQVSIQRSGSYACAGAIYNNEVIVTVAHCLVNINASQLMVRVGSNYWNSSGILVGVRNFTINKNYNPITMANDIAVIGLASKLNYTSTVKRIHLSSNHANNGALGNVSGWGSDQFGRPGLSTTLEAVNVSMITAASCASYTYGYGTRIMPSMFCASTPGKDICQGDAGSPLVSGNSLYGLASWGFGCGNPGYPSVYTNVPYLHSWITDAANNVFKYYKF